MLDKFQGEPRNRKYANGSQSCNTLGGTTPSWNIRTVFVAGGAGGGTEAASWPDPRNIYRSSDPVVRQLQPVNTRALYNHNMSGHYSGVRNIRFVGAGLAYDSVNSIPYNVLASVIRGYSDGMVPFHSQGGVSQLEGSIINQAYDAYCVTKHTGAAYSCGQLDLGTGAATRWTYTGYVPVPLFAGYKIQMIDDARKYNHSDEVGRLGDWITEYNRDTAPWYSSSKTDISVLDAQFRNDPANTSELIRVSKAPGTMDELKRGTDNALWWRTFNGGWWSAWQSLGGVLNSAPTAASWGNGRLDVFALGTDNALHHRAFDGQWHGWENHGGVLTSAPSVASWGPGRLDVFARGLDNALWHLPFEGGWHPWETHYGVLTSAPAAVALGFGMLNVYVRDTGNSLSLLAYRPGAWRPWQGLGGALTSAPVVSRANDTGAGSVFVRGTNNSYWRRSFDINNPGFGFQLLNQPY